MISGYCWYNCTVFSKSATPLRVFGSSRSGVADFEKTVQMYQQYPEIIDYLGNLISSVNVVRTTTDIKQAFEKDTQKAFGKTIMVWQE